MAILFSRFRRSSLSRFRLALSFAVTFSTGTPSGLVASSCFSRKRTASFSWSELIMVFDASMSVLLGCGTIGGGLAPVVFFWGGAV